MEQVNLDEGRVSGETALSRRPKPHFLTVGEGRNKRELCSTGRFQISLAADYLVTHQDKWTTVGELARAFYGANTPVNKERVRRRLSIVWNDVLVRLRRLLLYEFNGRRISAVKLHNPDSELDRQKLDERIEQIAKRCLWTQNQYELVKSIVHADEQLR